MRIAHVIESVDPKSGGTSSAFLEIVDALAGHTNCDVRAFAHAPDANLALEHASSRDRFELTGPGGQLRMGDLAHQTIRAIHEDRFDAIHLHGLWNSDLVRIALAAGKLGVSTLWQPHGMLVARAFGTKKLKKQLFMLAGLRRALGQAARIVYCTEGERQTSVQTDSWAAGRSEIVPLPVSCPIEPDQVGKLRATALSRLGLKHGSPTVVFMGRLHPVKRLELTLQAFEGVRKEFPELRLAVFGSGAAAYERSLRERAESLGLGSAVFWGGWVSREDRWLALAAGNVLTLNSMFENFGYVVPEALLVETGVAVTDNLAISQELASAGAGEVAASTPESLARAIVRALGSGDAMRSRARQWADETFSPGAVARRLVSLYESVLAGQTRSTSPAGQ